MISSWRGVVSIKKNQKKRKHKMTPFLIPGSGVIMEGISLKFVKLLHYRCNICCHSFVYERPIIFYV